VGRHLCFGGLGLSGNYGLVTYPQLVDGLVFALQNYNLIDLSNDYGIDYNLVETIKVLDLQDTPAQYIYKVGCNFSGNYDAKELIDRTVKDIEHFGINKFHSILFHRPSSVKVSADLEFFSFIKRHYPEIPFGMCTNSKELYALYKTTMDIKVVQLALNPLDYANTVDFLNTLKLDSVLVQARSILSSGLLSGKYDKDSIFRDQMRLRYNDKAVRHKFLNRINMAQEVVRFIKDEFSTPVSDIPNFLYSVFEKIPNVDYVIRGGSSLKQISYNVTDVSVDETKLSHFISKMQFDWGCEYV
jgi:aryl-alcohol dehydrogenase-like predicted oxidoreductase